MVSEGNKEPRDNSDNPSSDSPSPLVEKPKSRQKDIALLEKRPSLTRLIPAIETEKKDLSHAVPVKTEKKRKLSNDGFDLETLTLPNANKLSPIRTPVGHLPPLAPLNGGRQLPPIAPLGRDDSGLSHDEFDVETLTLSPSLKARHKLSRNRKVHAWKK